MSLMYIKQFIKLTRAHIGIVVLPSFWLGSLFALLLGYEFNIFIFLMGFLIIFLMYASASYINDYYDFEADKHNRQFGFSGGSGVLQKYPELKEPTRYLAFIFIFISMILTIFLAFISFIPFWSIVFIGIGAFFSWFYSAPPIRLSYRGVGEFPHFIAGLMNAAWGYLIFTGTININLIIFAIPLSLHLLNVILIFEIPDLEADIHGGKTNFIVNHGRKNSFLLITILFWATSIYFFSLAYMRWYSAFINFYLLAILSCIPSILSSIIYLKKPFEQSIATKSAIQTAVSLFLFSISMMVYFIILQF
jgi:1,4-dihydroxy-2-naphthoate polyprenyltransferase